MFTSIENRKSSRAPVRARIELRLGNGIVVEGQAVDVSLRGLMFETDSRLPVGKSVQVAMIAHETVDIPRIELGGRIARLDDIGVAVAFNRLAPEHVHQLRQLQGATATFPDEAPYADPYLTGGGEKRSTYSERQGGKTRPYLAGAGEKY